MYKRQCFYIPKPIAEAGIELFYLFTIIAIIFAILFNKFSKKRQENTGKQLPVFWINLMVLFLFPCIALILNNFPISFSIPELKGFNFRGGLHLSPELIALTFALAIYTAAFIAEIVRAGIWLFIKGKEKRLNLLD